MKNGKLVLAARGFLRSVGALTLDEAITFARTVDRDAFAPDSSSTGEDLTWLELADAVLRDYHAAEHEPGMRLELAIRRAMKPRGKGIRGRDPAGPQGDCPRYRSGIMGIDEATGGFYGVTAVAGAPGAGKSLAVLRAAMNAAVSGWRVIFYDCELGDRNFSSRVAAVVRSDEGIFKPLLEHHHHRLGVSPFHARDLSSLNGLDDLVRDAIEHIETFDRRVLIVLDNINSAARMLAQHGTAEEGWHLIRHIGEVARTVRKETNGECAWLLVAELNRAGGLAGKDLEYIADLDVRLHREKEGDRTRVRVAKGREGGEGDYGEYLRDWRAGRMIELEGI